MEHGEARMLVSARHDGELDAARAPELDRHLASCDGCIAFASGLDGLSALARALPLPDEPDALAARVTLAIRRDERRARGARRWRAAAALAATLAVAMITVLLQPLGPAGLPEAAAAETLTRITSFEMERVVSEERAAPNGVERVRREEHIWFRAPGLVRIETVTTGDVDERSLVIMRPGELYAERGSLREHLIGLPPSVDVLPEPLSATIAFEGTDGGPGPTIAGHSTRRYEVTGPGGTRRIVFVDDERFTVLGSDERFVLGKVTFENGLLVSRKRTISVSYNEPVPDDLFEIPRAPLRDRGFDPRPAGSLLVAPPREPEGFAVSAAGIDPHGEDGAREMILYTRGAFPILVERSQVEIDVPDAIPVSVAGRPGFFHVDLYTLPSIGFRIDGATITVTAPLGRSDLIELASSMYPE